MGISLFSSKTFLMQNWAGSSKNWVFTSVTYPNGCFGLIFAKLDSICRLNSLIQFQWFLFRILENVAEHVKPIFHSLWAANYGPPNYGVRKPRYPSLSFSPLSLSLSLAPFMRCVAMEVAVTTRKNKCRREIHPSIHPSVVVEFLSYVFADIIFPGNIASGRLLVAN